MTLLLRDSINAPLIPTDTPVVAGYGDGRYLWSPSWKDGSNWWNLFPKSVRLVIVISPLDSGDILDVETGDARPDQVPDWCNRFNRPGRRAPTVYCNRGTWPLVIDALKASGNDPAGPHIDWWIATLDGTQTVTVPPGGKAPVAIQYGGIIDVYDESIILDPTWVGLENFLMALTDQQQQDMFDRVMSMAYGLIPDDTPFNSQGEVTKRVRDIQGLIGSTIMPPLAAIQTAVANLAAIGGWTPAQQAEVDAIKAALDRIEAAFKGA